jgi:4-amino-4-deoxy-L-arabinose transferase-like glycosyltransferase
MLIALPLAVGFVAALAWRLADGPGGRRPIIVVAALALGIRLAAVVVVFSIARQVHGEGTWLNDEASFFLATESLMPYPLDRALPVGLDHLGGDGYLGLITTISLLGGGVVDSNAFRVVNAALGAAVVVLSALVARRLFGPRAGFVAGLGLAVWPTLVLWSATMLRDTFGSFALVAVWWALSRARDTARDVGWLRVACGVFLSLVILLSLRPYLGGALAVGVLAWAAYPLLRKLSRRALTALVTGAAVVGVVFAVQQARRIDFATHELFYRQTVTRMETLGLLYTDQPPDTENLPMKPGTAVALADPHTGWLLGGVVKDFVGPDVVRVAFTDQSIRELPLKDLVPVQSANIPPLQLVASVLPGVGSYLVGTSVSSDSTSLAWVVPAVATDALVVLAIAAGLRSRLSPREWLFPLCIVGGTMLALVAVPGAPGNAERHRATQVVPLLLVLATGLLASRGASARASDRALSSMTTSPTSEPAPAISRMRSAR